MVSEDSLLLDDDSESKRESKKWFLYIFVLTLTNSAYLFLAEYFKEDLPNVLFEIYAIEVRFSSIAFLFILLLNAALIPYYLDRARPTLSIPIIAVLSGLIFFAAILIKVFTFNYYIHKTGIQMNYGYILFTSSLLAFLAAFASNVRIVKLRGKKTYLAWIALFVAWYALTAIAKM